MFGNVQNRSNLNQISQQILNEPIQSKIACYKSFIWKEQLINPITFGVHRWPPTDKCSRNKNWSGSMDRASGNFITMFPEKDAAWIWMDF